MAWAATDLLQIARVLKSNGTDGEILMGFRDVDPEDLNLKEPVFINFDGLPVPFFIESFKTRGTNKALVRITGTHNLDDAEELVGKEVFAQAGSLAGSEDDGEMTLEDLTGWIITDDSDEKIGTITAFEDIPGNPCLYVDTEAGQVMIPFNEDFILSLDEETEVISMSLPEGLLSFCIGK